MNWNVIISDVVFNFRISKLSEKFVNETLFYCFFFRNLIWLFPWHSEGNYYWGLTFVNNNLCKCLCRLELSWCWFFSTWKMVSKAIKKYQEKLLECSYSNQYSIVLLHNRSWLVSKLLSMTFCSILYQYSVCFFSSRATHYSLVCCISWCMFKLKQSSVCSLFIMIHPCNRRFSAMNDLYAIALYFSVVFLLKEILVVIFSIYSQ